MEELIVNKIGIRFVMPTDATKPTLRLETRKRNAADTGWSIIGSLGTVIATMQDYGNGESGLEVELSAVSGKYRIQAFKCDDGGSNPVLVKTYYIALSETY